MLLSAAILQSSVNAENSAPSILASPDASQSFPSTLSGILTLLYTHASAPSPTTFSAIPAHLHILAEPLAVLVRPRADPEPEIAGVRAQERLGQNDELGEIGRAHV